MCKQAREKPPMEQGVIVTWRYHQVDPIYYGENSLIIFISFYPDTWINLDMDDGTTKKFYFSTKEKSFEEANDFCVSEGAILFEPKGPVHAFTNQF